ncbi:MAG: hypothetical protein JW864_03175 [Spirochaetes bacterium]|nr:hypothetical protein [Spirochaetota bacterium]
MSRELQERADIITKELKEALIPLQNEIKKMRSSDNSGHYIDTRKPGLL